MRTDGLRDYLYISVRKTERMASTLPASTLKRLTALNFQAGPVGAGVALSEAQRPGVAAAVAEVENAIRKEHRVRRVFDEDVRVGHLSGGGLHPLTFVARVTHISLSEDNDPQERYVVGTPLFVALHVPE